MNIEGFIQRWAVAQCQSSCLVFMRPNNNTALLSAPLERKKDGNITWPTRFLIGKDTLHSVLGPKFSPHNGLRERV